MVQIFKNFLTSDECKILTDICFLGVKEGWVGPGISRENFNYQNRFTSRLYMKDITYPDFVIDIRNKIFKFMNISYYPLIVNHGSEGVVVSITYPGGDVYRHKDPRSDNNFAAFRCNVMTQSSNYGGNLYVDDQFIDIGVGDLHCYYASEQSHYVTEVEGDTSRVLWMFGVYRPLKDFKKFKGI